MWGGSLFVRETSPSSSDRTENRSYLKACSAGSPLRTAGQLCKTHVEWLWLIINTLGLWGSEETNTLKSYCHFSELRGYHSVLLGLFCGHGSTDTPPSSSGCYMPERMRQKFLSCDKKTCIKKTWEKKKRKRKQLESPQVSSWQKLQVLETEGIHKGHG